MKSYACILCILCIYIEIHTCIVWMCILYTHTLQNVCLIYFIYIYIFQNMFVCMYGKKTHCIFFDSFFKDTSKYLYHYFVNQILD